jgi:hypothetical protein
LTIPRCGDFGLRAPAGCGTLGLPICKFVEKMGEAPMDEKLVAACQMFLVPATIRRDANFFKHADRDPEATLYFDPAFSE